MGNSLDVAAGIVEAVLTRNGVVLTLGGEPTYLPDHPEGAEWSVAALGPTKLGYAYALADALREQSMPASLDFYSPGKRYPGEINPFHNGGCSGGGGYTVAYAGNRRPGQIYVVTALDGSAPGDVLSAWEYRGQDDITFAWKSDEVLNGIGVAIDGVIGALYVGAYDRLLKINSSGGYTMDFADGSFANGMVPIISGGHVWTFGSSGAGDTVVYDIATLDEVARFPGTRGDLNSPFGAPGAFGFNAFLLDHGRIYDYPGLGGVAPRSRSRTPVTSGIGRSGASLRRLGKSRA